MVRKHFFEEEAGYWVSDTGDNSVDFPDHVYAAFPSGWVEITERPNEFYDWVNSSWVLNEEREAADMALNARKERDFLLKKNVDKIASNALRWEELTDSKRAQWAQYRLDLLNVPQQEGFPRSIDWPILPE